jgi:uncharacterized protein YlxW (UPF0749 family)
MCKQQRQRQPSSQTPYVTSCQNILLLLYVVTNLLMLSAKCPALVKWKFAIVQATQQKAAEDVRSRLSLAQTAIKRTQDQQQQLAQERQTGVGAARPQACMAQRGISTLQT